MRFIRKIIAGFGISCILSPGISYAQNFDYTGLENVFGEPVTTSATGKPQKSSEAPATMDIITADDIRRSGAENVPQMLGRLSGIVNWQQMRGFSDVGIRGQNTSLNPSILVLVNGRQVYIDSYGYTDWSLIPVQLEEIKQIEVVKGPNTALFGFNAVTGVINIVTYNPKYDDIGDAGVKGGTNGYKKGHFLNTFKLSDKIDLRLSGGVKEFGEYELRSKTNSDGYFFSEDSYFSSLNADGVVKLSDKTQLRLEGSHSEGKAVDEILYVAYNSQKQMSSWKTTLTSDTSLGLLEANLYQNQFDVTTYSAGFPAYAKNYITIAQLQDLFRVGTDHTFRVMGEYRHNIATSPGSIGPGAQMTYDIYATSGMWNWVINPQWDMTHAVRLDMLDMKREGPIVPGPPVFPGGNSDFDRQLETLSVNSGLVWKPTDIDTVRFLFARGIQMPSLFNTGTWLPFLGVVYIGDPQLDPSIVNNYEIGYDRTLPDIGGKFRSAVFYRQTKDVVSTSADLYFLGPDLILETANIGDSDTLGFELGLEGKFRENWSWDMNYAYQNSIDSLRLNTDFQSVAYHGIIPHHIINAHLGWAEGPWEADLFAQYGSSYTAIGPTLALLGFERYEVDGYFTSGLRLAYTLDDNVTVAFSGVDISQARVASSPMLENERQLFLSLSKKF